MTNIVFENDQFIVKQLVQSTIDHLTNVLKVDKVVMDPQAWNVRAISCYEKCGFEKVKLLPKHEWHEGKMQDCWPMVKKCGI